MSESQEKKYRKIGWLTSVGVQVVLLLLFYFLIAWKEPFPPIPSYGIELSFGLENTGSGELPVSRVAPAEEPESDANEFSETETEAVTEASAEPTPSEQEADEIAAPVTNQPSPDVVKEKTAPKEEVKPVKETTEQAKEQPKQEPEKEPALNPAASMPQADAANKSKGETGDEGVAGKKEGTIDGRALMGEQGGANGASLQMAGWVWDSKPEPKDNSSESGKIVYRIKIDGDGYIIDIELVSSTVSPSVERFYRQSVERLSFSKTNEYKPAPTSSGTITFIIRSK